MSSNIIAADLKTGANFKIGHFTVIGEGCTFGDNVTIGSHTVIGDNVQLNDGCIVGNHCEIGKNLVAGRNVNLQGRIRTADGCVIEDDATLKYGTILTSRVLIKKNAFLGPNVITLGSTHLHETKHGIVIGERCYIGAGSKIAASVKIANDVTVGAMGFVNKDLDESGIYVGIPVKLLKQKEYWDKKDFVEGSFEQ
jgi:acetyltransferase-like isoleucine patch superfamily enzyme